MDTSGFPGKWRGKPNENQIIWCVIIFHGTGLKLFAMVQRSMQAVRCIYFGCCDSRNRSLWTMLGLPLMFIEFILLTSINYAAADRSLGSQTMQHFASWIYYYVLRFRSSIVHLQDGNSFIRLYTYIRYPPEHDSSCGRRITVTFPV